MGEERSQEPEERSQESGVRSQNADAGERSQEPEARSQNADGGERSQEPGIRTQNAGGDLRSVVRAVIEEMVPGYKDEKSRREMLETRVNELVAENQRSRAAAEQAERSATIRGELQKLGVAKVELAYRAVKDDVYRSEDGRLMAQGGSELRDYLAQFVGENPELLPARLAGGSGASAGQRSGQDSGGVDLARIKPGMNPEELDRVRQEVARVAAQTLRGA